MGIKFKLKTQKETDDKHFLDWDNLKIHGLHKTNVPETSLMTGDAVNHCQCFLEV